MAINFLIPPVFSQEFEFSAPATALLNESFTVVLSSNTSETYDVKIFIQDKDKKILSQIYDDGWKNPHFYLKSAFPEKKEFDVRGVSSLGEQELCARLRIPEKTSFKEKCMLFTLLPSLAHARSEEKLPAKEEKAAFTENSSKKEIENISSAITPSYQALEKSSAAEKSQKIILNTEEKDPLPSMITTRYQKQQSFLMYAFLAVCLVIIILLVLKKL